MRKCVVGLAVVVVLVFSVSAVLAQDLCEGNFDCDQDVDGTDAAVFKADFGRSPFFEPCDTCIDSPCPCSPCPAGMTDCNSTCVNTDTDEDNCGGCENVCNSGELCVGGTCDLNCPIGLTECAGTCVDTDTDESNCGLCFNPCGIDEVCIAGACTLNCPSGLTNCAGNCVDTDKDEDNCGGCANTCDSGELCVSASCTVSCQSGMTNCSGTCVDTDKDEDNCGGCFNPCGSGELCVASSCETVASGYPAAVEKTGQTTSYATGDDGDLEEGVAWPNPRFTDNSDGTVTDNLTGLIWLKDANCIATNYPGFDNDSTAGDGRVTWQHALDFVAGINAGTYPDCGAGATDWRFPNRNELASLVHKGYYNPAVPNTAGTGQWSAGDPFTNVQSDYYWSSSTYANGTDLAWYVDMGNGSVDLYDKTNFIYVWPVRGGQ